MNDPQIWTLVGVVTALIFASNRQLVTSIRREIDALDAKINAKFGAKIDALEAKMDARFSDVDHRLESLEGDMHLVKAHLIGQSSVTPTRG